MEIVNISSEPKNNTETNSFKKKIAILKHPLIEAVVQGLYRFNDEKQAIRRLHEINDKFIVAKETQEILSQNKLRLWIKDYES
ncbi:MAG: hypothetical protein WCJ33_04300, partial [Pseudomonadota bacterium]